MKHKKDQQLDAEIESKEKESKERLRPLEPEAYTFYTTPEEDGLAPKDFIQLSALRKEAERRGRSLSLEELRLYYGRDETSPAEPECAVCGRRFVPRVWAIGSTDGIVVDRDSGKPLLAGAYVVRYSESKPQPIPACGSPFNQKSCLSLLRQVWAVGEDGPIFGNKALPAMPYERAAKRADQLLRQQEENNQRLARLGGLINRPRLGGPFRPSTPRGQRRGGGNTPHNWGR
jgi:hypothetical protein